MANIFPHSNDIIRNLQTCDFPECTHRALNYLIHIDTVALGTFDISCQVSTDFILFSPSVTSTKTLDSIQELQLLEILLDCFTSLQRSTRLSVFNKIFGGKLDDVKVNVFNKLASLAVSLQSSPLMDCAVMWIQQHGHQSRPAIDVAHCLIHDFCDIHKDLNDSMLVLSSVFPLLCTNLIVIFTHIYTCHDVGSVPPTKLVQYVSHWLNEPGIAPTLADKTQSPVYGLMVWSICGTVLAPSPHRELYSRLQLALLHTIQSCPASLLLTRDLEQLVTHMLGVCKAAPTAGSLHSAVEQFAQIVQMCLVTKVLRSKRDELIKVLWKLPPNRLLDILMKCGSPFIDV